MGTMRRTLVCTLVLVALVGCGRGPTGPGGGPPGTSGSGGSGRTGSSPPNPGSTTGRPGTAKLSSATRVLIFAATLRRYLMPPEDSFAQVPTFTSVWVLDATDPGPFDQGQPRTAEPITAAEQAGIIAELANVLPVKFVHARAGVIESTNGCDRVRDGGVLVTLGPPRGGPDQVEVAFSAFVACLDATWLTYVVVREAGGGWTVTGTTGPVAIA